MHPNPVCMGLSLLLRVLEYGVLAVGHTRLWRNRGAGRCLQCCSILSVPFRSVCCDMRSRTYRAGTRWNGAVSGIWCMPGAYTRRTFWYAEGRNTVRSACGVCHSITIRCIRHRDACRTALLRENSVNSMIRGCSPAFCGGERCNSVPLRIISQRKR